MTRLESSEDLYEITYDNFTQWCNDNGIPITRDMIKVLTTVDGQPMQIARLEIVPDLTTADVDKIIAKWPSLTHLQVPNWLDPNDHAIP